MITSDEPLISYAEAARALPRLRGGRPIAPSTLWRWATVGILGRTGMRIRLETLKVGGSTFTSREALTRFSERLSATEVAIEPPPPAASRGHAHAEAALDRVGI